MHEGESESEVTQSCLTLHDPMDYSLPGSSVHGISQARVLEWVAIAFSIDGHELETTLGDSQGQGSLVRYSHGVTESDTTEQPNNKLNTVFI